jgi:hypothetical protein
MRAAIAIGWGVKSGGERMAVGPGGAVPIPPGVWHRPAGRMTILDVVVPPFDPADGWLDGGPTFFSPGYPERARDQTASPA